MSGRILLDRGATVEAANQRAIKSSAMWRASGVDRGAHASQRVSVVRIHTRATRIRVAATFGRLEACGMGAGDKKSTSMS